MSSDRTLAGLRPTPAPARPAPLGPMLSELAGPAERRARAREDGFDAGYNDGLAAAIADHAAAVAAETARAAEARSRSAALLAALAAAVDEWTAAARRTAEGAALDTVEAAILLTEAVIGHELRHSDAPVRDALARALATVPDGAAEVRVNPADRGLLDTHDHHGRTLRIIEDDSVEPGGCIVRAGCSTVDATVSEALARVRAALEETP